VAEEELINVTEVRKCAELFQCRLRILGWRKGRRNRGWSNVKFTDDITTLISVKMTCGRAGAWARRALTVGRFYARVTVSWRRCWSSSARPSAIRRSSTMSLSRTASVCCATWATPVRKSSNPTISMSSHVVDRRLPRPQLRVRIHFDGIH